MVCIVLTRNGEGDPLLFDTTQEARLHPIVQFDDVFLSSFDHLVGVYPRSEIAKLARLVPFGPKHDRVRYMLACWQEKNDDSRKREALEAFGEIWDHLIKTTQRPPAENAKIIARIIEDRRATDGITIRVRQSEGSYDMSEDGKVKKERKAKEPKAPKEPKAAKAPKVAKPKAEKVEGATRSRIRATSIIRMGSDGEGKQYGASHNPCRAGSAVFDRFAQYKDGMTVQQAVERGLSMGDINYHAKAGYLSIEPVAEEQSSTETGEEGTEASAEEGQTGEGDTGEQSTGEAAEEQAA